VKDHKYWCPTCVGFNQTIVDMKNLAWAKNGECLSEEYKDAHIKLE